MRDAAKENPGRVCVLLVHWCAGEAEARVPAQGKFIAGWRNLEQSYFSCALKAAAVTWARCLYLNHLPFAARASAHLCYDSISAAEKKSAPVFGVGVRKFRLRRRFNKILGRKI
jgi:hypothetical protein